MSNLKSHCVVWVSNCSFVKVVLHLGLEVGDVGLESVWGTGVVGVFDANHFSVWVQSHVGEETGQFHVILGQSVSAKEFCVAKAFVGQSFQSGWEDFCKNFRQSCWLLLVWKIEKSIDEVLLDDILTPVLACLLTFVFNKWVFWLEIVFLIHIVNDSFTLSELSSINFKHWHLSELKNP